MTTKVGVDKAPNISISFSREERLQLHGGIRNASRGCAAKNEAVVVQIKLKLFNVLEL